MPNRLSLTPREAAALDRLLYAYTLTDDTDPGLADLRSAHEKVGRLTQDHTVYEAPTTAAAGGAR